MSPVSPLYTYELIYHFLTMAILWPLFLSQWLSYRFTQRRKFNETKLHLISVGTFCMGIQTVRMIDPSSAFGRLSLELQRALYTQLGNFLMYCVILVVIATAKTLCVQLHKTLPRWFTYSIWTIQLLTHLSTIPCGIVTGVSLGNDWKMMQVFTANVFIFSANSMIILGVYWFLYLNLRKKIKIFLVTLIHAEQAKAKSTELLKQQQQLIGVISTSNVAVITKVEDGKLIKPLPPTGSPHAVTRAQTALRAVSEDEQPGTVNDDAAPATPATPAPEETEHPLAVPTTNGAEENSSPPSPSHGGTRTPTAAPSPTGAEDKLAAAGTSDRLQVDQQTLAPPSPSVKPVNSLLKPNRRSGSALGQEGNAAAGDDTSADKSPRTPGVPVRANRRSGSALGGGQDIAAESADNGPKLQHQLTVMSTMQTGVVSIRVQPSQTQATAHRKSGSTVTGGGGTTATTPAPAAASQSDSRLTALYSAIRKMNILTGLLTFLLVATVLSQYSNIMGIVSGGIIDQVVHSPLSSKDTGAYRMSGAIQALVNQVGLAAIIWYAWSSPKVWMSENRREKNLGFWDTLKWGVKETKENTRVEQRGNRESTKGHAPARQSTNFQGAAATNGAVAGTVVASTNGATGAGAVHMAEKKSSSPQATYAHLSPEGESPQPQQARQVW